MEETLVLRKGHWDEGEDDILASAVAFFGERRWDALAKASGLKRNGKSCRLRWKNYLRPNINRTHFTTQEEILIIELNKKWGNRWAKIAKELPGRTDNDIKNYWRSHLRNKVVIIQHNTTNSNNNKVQLMKDPTSSSSSSYEEEHEEEEEALMSSSSESDYCNKNLCIICCLLQWTSHHDITSTSIWDYASSPIWDHIHLLQENTTTPSTPHLH